MKVLIMPQQFGSLDKEIIANFNELVKEIVSKKFSKSTSVKGVTGGSYLILHNEELSKARDVGTHVEVLDAIGHETENILEGRMVELLQSFISTGEVHLEV